MSRELKWKYSIDFSQAEKDFNAFLQKGVKSPMAGWDKDLTNYLKKLDASNQSWSKLQRDISQAAGLVAKFSDANGRAAKGMEQGYAAANQQLAGLIKNQSKYTDDLEKQAKYLQQSINLRNNANAALGGNKQFSPHSERQAAILQGLQGGMNLAGLGQFATAAGFAAAAIGGVKQLGDEARRVSTIVSDGGGKYDRLFNSTKAAESAMAKLTQALPIAQLETFKNNLIEAAANVIKGIADRNKATPEQEKLVKGALAGTIFGGGGAQQGGMGLRGDTLIEYKNLLRDQQMMEIEIANTRKETEHQQMAERRDFALEERQLKLETARKEQDLAKERFRLGQDHAISLQKFQEDFDFKQSQRKFQMDRANAQRDFALKQQDERQDFSRQQAYKAQDYNKETGRAAEDRNDELVDMSLSSASGVDYLKAARNYNKAQRRRAEDYAIEQGRAGQEFGIKQGREGRDFTLKQGDELKARALEVESHYYARRYEGLQLEIQYNRQIQDSITNMQRFNEDTAMAFEKLSNRKQDMEFSQKMGLEKLGLSEANQRYQFGQSVNSFGKGLMDLPPNVLQDLMKNNPMIAQAVQGYSSAANIPIPGLTTSAGAAGQQNAGKTAGGIIDFLASTPLGFLSPIMGAKTGADLLAGKLPWESIPDTLKKALGVPSFDTGGRVSSTGLAMVHEGEYVVPNSIASQMNYASPSMLSGRGSGSTSFNVAPSLSISGGINSDDLMRAIQEIVSNQLPAAIQGAVMKNNASVIDAMRTNLQAQRRGY